MLFLTANLSEYHIIKLRMATTKRGFTNQSVNSVIPTHGPPHRYFHIFWLIRPLLRTVSLTILSVDDI